MRRRDLFPFLASFMMGITKAKGGSIEQKAPRYIAEAWPAHTAILILLGAQEQLVACAARPSDVPWMFYLLPRLRQVTLIRAGALDAEALLRLKCDLLLLPISETYRVSSLQAQGLTTQIVGFTDFEGLLQCVDETASFLRTPLAQQRAGAYRHALQEALAEQPILRSDRPTVLHIASLSPLKVDGRRTIIDQWIHAAGGRNAALVDGNHVEVTREQLLAWDPDILICSATAGEIESITKDPALSQLQAVKRGCVYRNPAGLFLWDRYGPELLLQLHWARQVITTGIVDQGVMVPKIQGFYRDFYGLTITHNEAERILSALPPA